MSTDPTSTYSLAQKEPTRKPNMWPMRIMVWRQAAKQNKKTKKSIFLWKLQPFWLFPHSLGAIKTLMSLCAAQMVVNHFEDLPPSERGENNGRPNEADFSDHRNQSHRWRMVTHPLWRSRRCRRSPAVWSGFLRSHAERSPGTRRPTRRNPTPWRRLHEDTEWPSFKPQKCCSGVFN